MRNLAVIDETADVPTKKYVDDLVAAGGGGILYGVGPPPDALGSEGDFYFDDSANILYGPKSPAGGYGTPFYGQPDTPGPTNTYSAAPYRLGSDYLIKKTGQVTGMRFWRTPGTTPTARALTLYKNTTQVGTANTIGETGTGGGWEIATLATPVAAAVNDTFTVAYESPTGGYGYTAGNPVMRDPTSVDWAGGRYGSPGSGYPPTVQATSNYFADVLFAATASPWPVALQPGGGGLDQATADGLYVNVAGDTMTNGLGFGSAYGASGLDLARHIALYSTTYGFGVTSGSLNYNAPSGARHDFLVAGSMKLRLTGTDATMAGNLQVPQIVIPPTGGTAKGRLLTLTGVNDWVGFTLNCTYSSGWVLDDTSKKGWFFKLDSRAGMEEFAVYCIPAGANPHTDEYPVLRLDTAGLATFRNRLTGLSEPSGTTDATTKNYVDSALAGRVPSTRTVIAGNGLTGGGALSADVTLNVATGDTSLTVAADSVIVNTAVIEAVSRKGAANGYASLDSGTKIPIAQVPTGTTSATVCTGDRGVLAGGTTDQVLAKNSATNYDLKWVTTSAGGGIVRVVSSISGATTAAAVTKTDYVYICTAALTLTLPTAVGNTNLYTVKSKVSGTVNVATTSSQTIDGAAAPFVIDAQWMAVDFISDGANWVVV